ncbi:hypothetical protein J1614_002259 [Plenodomus biglobosus]|nr:hypothetical protein J1614_002259 [Plenodomus biglobosus]
MGTPWMPYEYEVRLRPKSQEDPWAQGLVATVFYRTPASEPVHIGSCDAYLIDRSQCFDFYDDLGNGPKKNMAGASDMAFTLFDRYGRLQEQFIYQQFQKGNGVWGRELDSGLILVINTIFIDRPFRRQGLASKLLRSIVDKMETIHSKPSFLIIRPNIALHKLKEHELVSAGPQTAAESLRRINEVLGTFLRKFGFRRIGRTEWFAMAVDTNHASHQLSETDDIKPVSQHTMYQMSESKKNQLDLSDTNYLEFLQRNFATFGPDNIRWYQEFTAGTKFLNIVCQSLLSRTTAKTLPIEALGTFLEHQRIRGIDATNGTTTHISHLFRGHDNSHIWTLALLLGYRTWPHPSDEMRLKYGCSCGHCVNGFLSKRMQCALLHAAKRAYAECLALSRAWDIRLATRVDGVAELALGSGSADTITDSKRASFLPPPLVTKLQSSHAVCKTWTQAFATFIPQFVNGIGVGVGVPSLNPHIQAQAQTHDCPQIPYTPTHIHIGTAIFATARTMTHPRFVQPWFEAQMQRWAECRNDCEFGFVSGMLGFGRDLGMLDLGGEVGG